MHELRLEPSTLETARRAYPVIANLSNHHPRPAKTPAFLRLAARTIPKIWYFRYVRV